MTLVFILSNTRTTQLELNQLVHTGDEMGHRRVFRDVILRGSRMEVKT